ncbi:MAG: hypothetical protein WC861_00945 [Candidatus Micrarchaeia archaeon]|jgi:hypothetical protein
MANTYLKAAIVTVALTLLGFFFISQFDAMRANELRQSVDDLNFASESERMLLLYTQVMGNGTELCGYAAQAASARSDQAYELSQKISFYEKSNVVNDEYERIKGRYYLANAAFYLNLMAERKYCTDTTETTVLFFYRVNTDCPECRAQGGVLDSLRTRRPQMRIFAFPIDSQYAFVNAFASRHNVTSAPALVIDDNYVLSGLKSESEIEPYLPARQAG